MNNEIVVCFEKGGQKDMAEAFARRIGAEGAADLAPSTGPERSHRQGPHGHDL